ncbi:uncharacterized protein LOC135501087 isoform X6 [Lineus longissimus]|uniref:uncharacterized protein LOC135501087 isoform X6 n=1 Tax=Lineus longissimus TaxID=88925 RepID=UPI00315D963C
MAGWHSLSGYLFYKQGGALGKFKSKRRQWYLFDESGCQLVWYKTQEDSGTKAPLGAIEIGGSSISLNLDMNNQFVITAKGKEHVFTADNHESMMIWLLGLQAKRDAYAQKKTPSITQSGNMRRAYSVNDVSPGSPSNWQSVSVKMKKAYEYFEAMTRSFKSPSSPLQRSPSWVSLQKRGSEPAVSHACTSMPDSLSRGSSFRLQSHSSRPPLIAEDEHFRPRLRKSDTINEVMNNPRAAFDNVIPAEKIEIKPTTSPVGDPKTNPWKGTRFHEMQIPLSKSFSPGLGLDEVSASSTESRRTGSILERSSSGGLNESDEDDVGDVFDYDLLAAKDEGYEVKVNTGKPLSERAESRTSNHQDVQSERTSSWSGQSSDSAIDRGETSMSELHNRLADMEKELIVDNYFLSENTKIELAKVMNREACIKTVLDKRDLAIQQLDEKLERLEHLEFTQEGNNNLSAAVYAKKLKEQCRVLQNQNRFLNEEVKKLTRIRQMEMAKFSEQEERNRDLESTIEKWKRDYLSILQSCISVPSGDILDGMEVNLYGGNRHKDRIQFLLDEAKKTNPCLPTLERLSKGEVHVDSLGFRHSYDNEGLMLHYVCTQLHEHYASLLTSHEEHQLKWKEYLLEHRNSLHKTRKRLMYRYKSCCPKELKMMIRGGIPPQYRGEVWKQLISNQCRDIITEKGQHYYSNLVNGISDSQYAGQYRKQISLDLLRTMPTNVHFDTTDADGIQKMQEVLQAYCVHSTTMGYCQGMNFIAAMSLLFMDKEDAFWCLVAMTEKYFTPHYFDHNLIGAQADQEVLKELLKEKLPKLHQHLDDLDIEISTVTLNWFLAIFFDSVPMETLLRIWDCFLLEGPKVLFRFAIAILKIHEKALLEKEDTISIMKHLKLCARLTFDSDGLIKVAFDEMRPFPRRKDIASKQTVYLKMLKEQVRKREEERRHLAEREEMFRELELTPTNALIIECASAYMDGKIWMCHGEQSSGKICKINCDENIMHDLNCEFDSRIMCITAVTEDLMLLGTLSWTLYAFSTVSREQLWNTRLHDAILDLCCHQEEGEKNKVFAALADGTIAIMEDINEDQPKSDGFYILIGHNPVTSLLLINQQLWCASGNSVVILHASTLDTMDSFAVSSTPFDHILRLMKGDHGVWIAVKGSSTLELWDTKQLVCRLLYDVRENRYYMSRRVSVDEDEENYFNPSRITAILPYDNYMWVGTARGDLIIYEITEKLLSKQGAASGVDASSNMTSTSCTTSLSSSPYTPSRSELIAKITPMDSVEEKNEDKSNDDHDREVEDSEEHLSDAENLNKVALTPRSSQDTDSTFTDATCKTVYKTGSGSDSGVVLSKSNIVTVKSQSASGQVGMKVLEADVSHEQSKEGVHLQIFVQVQAGKDQSTVNHKCVGTDSGESESEGERLKSQDAKLDSSISENITDVLVESAESLENSKMSDSGMDKLVVPDGQWGRDVNQESEEEEFVDAEAGSATNSPKKAVKDRGEVGEEVSDDEDEICGKDNLGSSENVTTPKTHLSSISAPQVKEMIGPENGEIIDKQSENVMADSSDAVVKMDSENMENSVENVADNIDNLVPSSCQIKVESVSGDSGATTAEDHLSDDVFQDDLKAKSRKDSKGKLEKVEVKKDSLHQSHALTPDDPSQRPLSPIMERHENTSTCTTSSYQEQPKSGVSTPQKSGPDKLKVEIVVEGDSEKQEKDSQLCPQINHLGDSLETDKNSALWSSYEDMSSTREYDSQSLPSEAKDVVNPLLLGPQWGRKDRRPSSGVVSATSDFPYTYDMTLLVKMKISDKPIKALLKTRSGGEDVVISCAGCYSDDEPVLKWRKEANEKLWTNEPIFEICQLTNTPKPPSYMRHRLSFSSMSQRSGDSSGPQSVSSPRMSIS